MVPHRELMPSPSSAARPAGLGKAVTTRLAVITGGGRGLGAALTEHLADHG
jgi:hypothetical protein